MPVNRFFFPGDLKPNEKISLPDEEAKHLFRAIRKKQGEAIEVVNGRGVLASAIIEEKELVITSIETTERPQYPLILAQAMLRSTRLEWLIEKGTELGVDTFWLFPGERGEFSSFRKSRLEKIAISALKQSGRLWLPEIIEKPSISSWDSLPKNAYYGDLNATEAFSPPHQQSLCFIVGPESGLTPKEISHLEQLGAKGVLLNTNTLRAETAALTSVAICTLFQSKLES